MADDQRRDAQACTQLAQLRAQLAAQRDMQRREGLVQQQHLGLAGQRPGQGHALLLAAGQRGRPAVGQRLEAEAVDQRVDPCGVVGLQPAPPAGQPEGNVLPHAEVREEGIVLEQVAHASGFGCQIDAGRGVQQRVAVQPHVAGTHPQQPGHGPQGQRFAGARRAVQRDEGGFGCECNVKVEPPAAVGDVELETDVDQGLPNPCLARMAWASLPTR
mmetsp:Transcript_1026/g.2612  ORF Transcript_1026/g.2612 Transcript_1026/m.2612 type:complete len:216 (+) Transcript_1026:400-1047(+)